ncbi:hypothetical protein SAY86_018731 [Trapa natans]|uniref:CRC domain-containing protein n=1 Tax=Trapa natans TaxID=22666 RepID=A0AAN7LAT4_TRANT|nr:hypothetical protein SAY86_018731 [Trapa natans]
MLKGTCERASSSMEMETPDRTKAASSSTPISKFEDSPVFNYINNLSPIKPVKSIHVAHTLSSLSFASLQSIFTSPHVSSLKESRLHRRHQNLDFSKLKSPSRDAQRASANERAEAELSENFGERISIPSTTVEQLGEDNKLTFELSHTLDYECGSPDSRTNQEMCLGRARNFDQQVEPDIGNTQAGPEGEWASLAPDTVDLLIFSSPNDAEAFQGIIQRSPGLETGLDAAISSSLIRNNIAELQKMQLLFQVASGGHPEMGDASESIEIKHTREDLGSHDLETMGPYPCDGLNNEAELHDPFAEMKPLSNFQRGLRRRCLDFEMVGAHHHKSLPDRSNSSSLSHPEGMIASTNLMLTSVNSKRGGQPSMCILPGIGLHLNSLASAKDCYNVINHDSSFSETHSNMSCQELLQQTVISNASDREADESGNIFVEDNPLAMVLLDEPNPNPNLNPNSPRKKRRRAEHPGDDDGCKRCNCKKSKCLKLYCECFAAGIYCMEPCACQDCFNKPIHEDIVLATRKQIESRNPLAFAPKVIRASDSVTENESMKTPVSARHKRGCNCKKSSCLKKYCECYQGGVGCSINCRCEGCRNRFGTKDGTVPVAEADCEAEDEEAEKREKAGLDAIPLRTEKLKTVLPGTPSGLSGSLLPQTTVPPPKSKPPRSSFMATVGSTYVLNSTQKLGKAKAEFLLPPLPNLEKPQQFNAENELPEILRGSSTPNVNIKTASPKSKRVSPPHGEFGSSPSLRSGRRLILQSIPSFPSLTPQH